MKMQAFHHPKTRKLARLLDVPMYAVWGVLDGVFNFAYQFARRGDIGRFDDADIAQHIDWRGDPAALLDALVDAGFLDAHPDHRLIVHDWPEHCEDSIHMSLARAGETFAGGEKPRLARLNRYERERAEQAYNTIPDKQCAHGMRTACAESCTTNANANANANKSTSYSSGETPPLAQGEEPHMTFPIKGGKTWALSKDIVANFRSTYGGDVDGELRKAQSWCEVNPAKRKTAKGMPRFLNGWLTRAADNGAPIPDWMAPPRDPTFEEACRMLDEARI